MIYFLITILLFILLFPSIWIRHTIQKHAKQTEYIPGTGSELVLHLAERFNIDNLKVEKCQPGEDHYSPKENTIRLSPNLYDGRSISAVAIASHEFGHALQYHKKETVTRFREQLTPLAIAIEKISIALIGLIPVLVAVFKVPQLGVISLIAVIASLFVSILLQLLILPMEWDASFNKALPILIEGQYLPEQDIPKAKTLLKAAALTYVASTLTNLLNVWRWLRILRR